LPDSHIAADLGSQGGVGVQRVMFSVDGAYLTKSINQVTRVWQISNGRATTRLTFDKPLTGIAFSADSRFLATARLDSSTLNSRIEVWNLESGRQIAAFTHEGAVMFMALSPGARFLATPDTKLGHDIQGGRPAFSTSDLRIWDPTNGKIITTLQHSATLTAAVFSPDTQHLAAAVADGGISVWAIAPGGGTAVARVNQVSGPSDLRFSNDGRYLAAAGGDGATRVWLWRSDDLIQEACSRSTRNLTFEEHQLYLSDQPYTKTCELLPIHSSFIDAGRALASAGDTAGAVSIFERALALGADKKLEPQTEARRLAGEGLAETAVRLATQGQIPDALETLSKALRINPLVETSSLTLNEICWQGGLWGSGKKVIDVCERAVRSDSTNLRIRDSRGLSRAEAGNLAGAIEDFASFVKWGESKPPDVPADEFENRRQWIRALQSGRNPFDDSTLRSMRQPRD
jgi:tetratricopeptide (TPR) repeat protein